MSAPPDPAFLFVYGTLRSRVENQYARFLAAHAEWLGAARIQGRLYRIRHYAGAVVSSEPGDWVIGELYRLPDPAATLPTLDRYEGCGPDDSPPHEFLRVPVQAMAESGESVSAWFYVYHRPVSEDCRIASGDFLEGEADTSRG